MPLDDLTNTDLFKGLVSVVTGGAFVGWYREHRRGKKDAYGFAMNLLDQQNKRIDELVAKVAILDARLTVEADAVATLKLENRELREENARLSEELRRAA